MTGPCERNMLQMMMLMLMWHHQPAYFPKPEVTRQRVESQWMAESSLERQDECWKGGGGGGNLLTGEHQFLLARETTSNVWTTGFCTWLKRKKLHYLELQIHSATPRTDTQLSFLTYKIVVRDLNPHFDSELKSSEDLSSLLQAF